ncbi:putative phosphotransferase [Cellulomonas chitinilytica]|uniref:Phosphotransferase n=1 Tax=Cellulomonas chitinilytica TaxID=398759 RepID=A0A919P3C5_9CELL|nr:aminoglycoside phosphotransferase family protein [Cellulomonas chitinilytica]GIG21955.1 putative phosphotransferase [Cellulomonas chitinilytica]
MHDDQVHVDAATVRTLIDDQFPRWRGLAVSELRTAATVNAVFRVGPDLVARFPLDAQDPDRARAWLQDEADAVSELARAATVPVPEPVALGDPGHGYPLPWTVQTWLPGHDATVEDPAASAAFARDLAAFIGSLRAVPTRGRRFSGAGRGGHLPDHDTWLEECFRRSERLLDVPPLRALWAELRRLPEVDADAMCHGDLTPPNVLVRDGRLAGVVDGGGFGPADPALDLVGAWHLLDDDHREVVRDALGCGDVQWRRGMAWAFQQAMGLVWYYVESNPTMSSWGRRTLDRVVRAAQT